MTNAAELKSPQEGVRCGLLMWEGKWQETVSGDVKRRLRGRGVAVRGPVDFSAVVVEGGNGVCFLSTLHTLFNGPFLRQTSWTKKKTTDITKTKP